MPNIFTRLILFLSSYAPLFLIIATRGWRESRHVAIGFAIVAVISVVVLFAFLHTVQKLSVAKVNAASVGSWRGGLMRFFGAFLVAFLGVQLYDLYGVATIGIVFVVI